MVGVIKESLLKQLWGGWVETELFAGSEGVTGPCLPPIKILIVHIQEQIGEGLSIRSFVGLISSGDAMADSWVWPSRHDEYS